MVAVTPLVLTELDVEQVVSCQAGQMEPDQITGISIALIEMLQVAVGLQLFALSRPSSGPAPAIVAGTDSSSSSSR